MLDRPVLDACCGPKGMWFDKNDSRCLFFDCREESRKASPNRGGTIVVAPDMIGDFTDLPFPDNAFNLVVFDPPHIPQKKETRGDFTFRYGQLEGDWRGMLRAGFRECFRVLQAGGVLIFKWNEVRIPLKEILALTDEKPLFGHKSGKASNTHWCTFMKEKE